MGRRTKAGCGETQPRGLLRRANKKQTVTALILLEKLCTEKEKEQHRFLAKNQVRTCGISERRFIQGDRPEAGAELAMTEGARGNGSARSTSTTSSRVINFWASPYSASSPFF
jgi:hypothetical protein